MTKTHLCAPQHKTAFPYGMRGVASSQRENRHLIAEQRRTCRHMPAPASVHADRQILYAPHPVGHGGRTDAPVEMMGPEFFASPGVEGAEIAAHLTGKDQVTGRSQHAAVEWRG